MTETASVTSAKERTVRVMGPPGLSTAIHIKLARGFLYHTRTDQWSVASSHLFSPGGGVHAIREKKHAGDLKLICQMLMGCATTAAVYLANRLPNTDAGSIFLRWFYGWMVDYLDGKGPSFDGQRNSQRDRLGLVVTEDSTAA